jgi:hypothetical protein
MDDSRAMQRLRTNLVGVDQGSVVLFSDFEDGGEMWTGRGAREALTTILYNGVFLNPPTVSVNISMWDMDQETNMRADVSTAQITREGFQIIFKTWGDTRIARVRATWTAIGEVKSEEDWDVD